MGIEPLYVTTPLFYVNAEPHLGHTYATLLGPVLARSRTARLHPDRDGRARGQDRPGGRCRGSRTENPRRPGECALPVHLGGDGLPLRSLHPHHRSVPRGLRAPRARANPCPGRHLLQQLPWSLLLRLRAVLPGPRAGGWPLSGPPRGADGDRRGELLLPHAGLPGAPRRRPRDRARTDHPRRLPARGPGVAAGADRRPLHLAAEESALVGDRGALRRSLRHLRLVRRAAELRERARPPRTDGPVAGGTPPDREGHSEGARDLLADDADGSGAAALPTPVC